MVMISLLPGVGRHFYVVARLQLMPYSETLPIRGIRVGCRSRTTPVQCRGARSLAYDLITGQGVVSSRAASILRSVETYPLIGRFVFAPTFICYSASCECHPTSHLVSGMTSFVSLPHCFVILVEGVDREQLPYCDLLRLIL